MKKNKPALLLNKLGPSCSDVDPDTSERNLPHLLPQFELNDLVRDLNLSKLQAELLASHLRGWNLLQQGVKMPHSKSQQPFSSFFKNDQLVYCNGVAGLLQELGYTHSREEWIFF